MLILGIDTATTQCSCAIGGHEGVLALVESARTRRHAENLVPAISVALDHAGVQLAEVSVVAVDVGPGLFTGLRVGLATAKAIAVATGVPMIGVSSLDLLAHRVRFTRRLIAAVVDARRGEVFHAFYRPVPGGVQRVSEPRVAPPSDVVSEVVARGGDVLFVGDGAVQYREEFANLAGVEFADRGESLPSAGALVQLAHARALREEFVQPSEIVPLYLRRPDAEINWMTREGRHSESQP